MATLEPRWIYTLFGLNVNCDHPLPELTPGEVQAGPEVFIRWAEVPEHLPNARFVQNTFEATESAALLKIDGVARYLVSGGDEIRVHPADGADDSDVRTFLLGSALGLLCHQRCMLPLHANAFVVHGKAVAIAGRSGAGKSTLAAYFLDKGYPLLTDDVCVISFPEHTRPTAWLGIPRVKLWHDSAIALNKNTASLERVFNGIDKFKLDSRTPLSQPGYELERIYVLCPHRDEVAGEVEAITGARAMAAIYEHTYRSELLNAFEGNHQRFSHNLELAQSVRIYKLPWRHDYRLLPSAAAALEAHFNSIAAPVP